MSPTISGIALVVAAAVVICLSAFQPTWLGDSNVFLSNFINHEYLNILGVILAITLASLSQLHLSLNRMEERTRTSLSGTRAEIKSSAWWLIGGFLVGLVLAICKPLVVTSETGASIVNGLALWVLLFYILVLADITTAIFDLRVGGDDDDSEGGPEER